MRQRLQEPAPYAPNLTPAPSPLRPHCLAKERLQLWKPASGRSLRDANGRLVNLEAVDLDRINDVMLNGWAPATLGTYGAGLLVFHVYCDMKAVPEDQRAPACHQLTSAFVSAIAGTYSGSTIANYLYGIRAWHLIHGVPWSTAKDEMEVLLRGAAKLAPKSSKRKHRRPYTTEYILQLLPHLDPKVPLDASARSCLLTTFYSGARVCETTVPNLHAFDPALHVTPADRRQIVTREGLAMTELTVPVTKSAPGGEKLQHAEQDGDSDPNAAWSNHETVNAPPPNGPLFAYRVPGGHKPLTKTAFIKRLAAAARKAGLDPLTGHGIRIGATLEYLLRGVPFETVKVIGRWSSDAFILYLRKHAQILAPYMQARPRLHDEFIRYTMPPVR